MSNFFKACKSKNVQEQAMSYLTGAIMSLISTLSYTNSNIIRGAFIKRNSDVYSIIDNERGFSDAARICDTYLLNFEIISEAVGTGRLWINFDYTFFNIVIDFNSATRISIILNTDCVKRSDGSDPDDKIDTYLFLFKTVYNTLPSTILSGNYL